MKNKLYIFRANIPYGGGAVGVIANSEQEAQEEANDCYTYGNGDMASFELIHTLELKDEHKSGILFEETTAE